MTLNPQVFVRAINAEAEMGRWFYVAGIAREAHAILYPLRDQLTYEARQAVEHYHPQERRTS